MKNTYAVYTVFADGNPQIASNKHPWDPARNLTAGEAIAVYRVVRAKYPRTPPFVGIIDEDNEERGWFDDDMLEDELND